MKIQDMHWKPIVGYEGRYDVCRNGDIYSYKAWGKAVGGKLLNQTLTPYGYLAVNLYKDGTTNRFLAHRLVASAFIDNPLELPLINHIDRNKINNTVENLEWCTPAENVEHAVKMGAFGNMKKGAEHHASKLDPGKVREIRQLARWGVRQKDIADKFGIGTTAISNIINYRRWKHVSDY